jgi:hypothetical protein
MSAKTLGALATIMGLLLAAGVLASSSTRKQANAVLDPRALTAGEAPARFSGPPSEVPPPLDPDADAARCVACRLAQRTTGSLPAGSFTLEPEVSADGVVVRVIATDPQARATLWQSMLARSALLEALRNGESMPLCASCTARRALISQVEIRARRTASGLILAYASKNPAIVQQIQALVRGVQANPVRF